MPAPEHILSSVKLRVLMIRDRVATLQILPYGSQGALGSPCPRVAPVGGRCPKQPLKPTAMRRLPIRSNLLTLLALLVGLGSTISYTLVWFVVFLNGGKAYFTEQFEFFEKWIEPVFLAACIIVGVVAVAKQIDVIKKLSWSVAGPEVLAGAPAASTRVSGTSLRSGSEIPGAPHREVPGLPGALAHIRGLGPS